MNIFHLKMKILGPCKSLIHITLEKQVSSMFVLRKHAYLEKTSQKLYIYL